VTLLPLPEAARALGVSTPTLRRWLRAGAPQTRRGRRGRGGHALLDPAALAAWRQRQAAGVAISARELAAWLPEAAAARTWTTFTRLDGPHKRRCAGALAGAWFEITTAVLDELRRADPSIPELADVPEPIDRLLEIDRA
jgi:hypothetical protein